MLGSITEVDYYTNSDRITLHVLLRLIFGKLPNTKTPTSPRGSFVRSIKKPSHLVAFKIWIGTGFEDFLVQNILKVLNMAK